MAELAQQVLGRGIELVSFSVCEVLCILVCGCSIRARDLFPARRVCGGEIALADRSQVGVQLCNMRSLCQLAALRGAQEGNVAYDAIRLLEELVQVLFPEDMRLYRLGVVRSERLVQYGCYVHGCVLQLAGRDAGLSDECGRVSTSLNNTARPVMSWPPHHLLHHPRLFGIGSIPDRPQAFWTLAVDRVATW